METSIRSCPQTCRRSDLRAVAADRAVAVARVAQIPARERPGALPTRTGKATTRKAGSAPPARHTDRALTPTQRLTMQSAVDYWPVWPQVIWRGESPASRGDRLRLLHPAFHRCRARATWRRDRFVRDRLDDREDVANTERSDVSGFLVEAAGDGSEWVTAMNQSSAWKVVGYGAVAGFRQRQRYGILVGNRSQSAPRGG
jgi:hypothetical protein